METLKELLVKYSKPEIFTAKKINFKGIGNNDVYNITALFKFEGEEYIVGRVESRAFGSRAKAMFFKKQKGEWIIDDSFEKFDLEDPFIKKIANEFILGGVEVKGDLKSKFRYRTVFYKGEDLRNLKRFFNGPWGMKDIRLVELPSKKIGVFTRPQGKVGGRGKIGFTIIDSFDNLTKDIISNAYIIEDMFHKKEWGGVNDALILNNGLIGVLGHIANYSIDGKTKNYYPIVFCFDFEKKEFSKLKIIFRRDDILGGESKLPELYNVIFPGGIIREGETAKIYIGLGDAEAYEIILKDPFIF